MAHLASFGLTEILLNDEWLLLVKLVTIII